MSNTKPIPANKDDIALCTAIAGELLGLKMIYMDAGSGAHNAISTRMINTVSSGINIPLTIGGGIRDYTDKDGRTYTALEVAAKYFRSGADKVSIGSDAVLSV